jgi:hypothetical protein
MSFYLCVDLVILDGFSDDAVAVEDGLLLAVGTGSGSGGGAKVDFGNDETYVHSNSALLG